MKENILFLKVLDNKYLMKIYIFEYIINVSFIIYRYDSEYDNYRAGHITSDAESDFAHEDLDSDVGAVLDELSLENIREISKNIPSKFGATRYAFAKFKSLHVINP